MGIRQAVLTDLSTVKHIAESTISEIYPHYYPKGAVDFFLEHHSEENISDDIQKNRVYLCCDVSRNAVGTVTVIYHLAGVYVVRAAAVLRGGIQEFCCLK